MADGDFSLVSKAGDVIDLNQLLSSDTGVQAVAGLTGFGLPPVEVLYQVGAGDGARFRGQRALPRDIDLPLYITGPTRAALREQVNRLAAALSDECRLQWDDGSQVWELKVRRVGGGEYVYGTDTDGTELTLTITLRSESALWTAVEESFTYFPVTNDTATRISLPPASLGTAPSRPLVRISGPTFGFVIENDARTKRMEYRGMIPANDYIDVDMENGSVTNRAGNNCYSYLAPGPGFFELTAGEPGLWVTLDRTSDTYVEVAAQELAINHIINPTFAVNNAGWNFWGYPNVADQTNLITFEPGHIRFKQADYRVDQGDEGPLSRLTSATIQTLAVGRRYLLHVEVASLDPYVEPYPAMGNLPATVSIDNRFFRTAASITPGGQREHTVEIDFVARHNEVVIDIAPPTQLVDFGGRVLQGNMRVTAVSLTDYPIGYFDGDTPDTAQRTYSWDGTAHASRSRVMSVGSTTAVPVELPNGAGVYVRANAKNWMVV